MGNRMEIGTLEKVEVSIVDCLTGLGRIVTKAPVQVVRIGTTLPLKGIGLVLEGVEIGARFCKNVCYGSSQYLDKDLHGREAWLDRKWDAFGLSASQKLVAASLAYKARKAEAAAERDNRIETLAGTPEQPLATT